MIFISFGAFMSFLVDMQRYSARGQQVTRNSIRGQLGQIGVEYIHQQCTPRDAWLLNYDLEHFCGRDALKFLIWISMTDPCRIVLFEGKCDVITCPYSDHAHF